MDNEALKISGLSFAYTSEKKILDNLSLTIKKGSYCVVLGHNGSGKSTLAKLVTGLLEADAGSIEVFGTKLTNETVYGIRSIISIVFQNPDNQFIGATVRDDIAFGLENHQVPQEKMNAIIEEYAAKVGMTQYLDKEPTNLSGGQKQRVAIAGVLAMAPKIVIFDEATSMLDPKGKATIKRVVNTMRTETPDITIISITHDIEEALLADEVLIINEGKIAKQGTPSEVFKNAEEIRNFGLDLPFIYRLANDLKSKGIEVSPDLEKLVKELCQ